MKCVTMDAALLLSYHQDLQHPATAALKIKFEQNLADQN
jgi:hypothetical protein